MLTKTLLTHTAKLNVAFKLTLPIPIGLGLMASHCCRLHGDARGHFEGGTRGNAVPIVEKLPERMGTAFPLLKCLRTHKTHLKFRKKIKNGLRLLPYAKPSRSSVDS